MIHRFLYSVKKSVHHRHGLAPFLKAPLQLASLTTLTISALDQQKIKVLALDFDGVLSPYGAVAPLPALQTWLHHLSANWPGKIFILSNKPFKAREDFMKAHFPSITFVTGVAKKPYPEGLKKIIALANCEPQAVLMVDDRLLTGILAAKIANAQALLISNPLRDLKSKKGLHEIFFSCLRWLDKAWMRLIG